MTEMVAIDVRRDASHKPTSRAVTMDAAMALDVARETASEYGISRVSWGEGVWLDPSMPSIDVTPYTFMEWIQFHDRLTSGLAAWVDAVSPFVARGLSSSSVISLHDGSTPSEHLKGQLVDARADPILWSFWEDCREAFPGLKLVAIAAATDAAGIPAITVDFQRRIKLALVKPVSPTPKPVLPKPDLH